MTDRKCGKIAAEIRQKGTWRRVNKSPVPADKNIYPNIPKTYNSRHSPDAQETVTSTSDRGVMGSNPICRETGGSSMVEHDTPSPSFLGAFSSMKRRAV